MNNSINVCKFHHKYRLPLLVLGINVKLRRIHLRRSQACAYCSVIGNQNLQLTLYAYDEVNCDTCNKSTHTHTHRPNKISSYWESIDSFNVPTFLLGRLKVEKTLIIIINFVSPSIIRPESFFTFSVNCCIIVLSHVKLLLYLFSVKRLGHNF